MVFNYDSNSILAATKDYDNFPNKTLVKFGSILSVFHKEILSISSQFMVN